MTKLQPWQLLQSEDISPSPFFPLEKRVYRRPDGQMIEDFYVTTLADSAHIIPVTKAGKIVLIKMFKQGVSRIVVQFPAGRREVKHSDMEDVAIQELAEETGILINKDQLHYLFKQAVMTTKSSEMSHVFWVKDVEITHHQKLDDNEEIEILEVFPHEVDEMIESGEMIEGLMIADWYVFKHKILEALK